MEDRQHTTKECADKLIPEIICFRKKFDLFLVKTAFETKIKSFYNRIIASSVMMWKKPYDTARFYKTIFRRNRICMSMKSLLKK